MKLNVKQFKKPLVIAGPCSAESQEQMLSTAKSLKDTISIFRAGIWKPRTRPNSFEGMGQKALTWMQEVKSQTGLKVATEVANAKHVEHCLKANVDVLWIGARTTVNPFYVQEIASALSGVDIAVMVKNPLHPELSLWMGALERLNKKGIDNLFAIHRGFFTLEKSAFRNEPKWEIPIKLKRLVPDLPLLCDPSHISGNTHMIAEVSQIAMDLNMDGLMIESHHKPSQALSDAQQQITPNRLIEILNDLILRTSTTPNPDFKSTLKNLRSQIDIIDKQLLEIVANRTEIVKEIGHFKKANNVTILQIERWFEILKSRKEWGEQFDLDTHAIAELFELIHKHSVLMQTHILNQNG